ADRWPGCSRSSNARAPTEGGSRSSSTSCATAPASRFPSDSWTECDPDRRSAARAKTRRIGRAGEQRLERGPRIAGIGGATGRSRPTQVRSQMALTVHGLRAGRLAWMGIVLGLGSLVGCARKTPRPELPPPAVLQPAPLPTPGAEYRLGVGDELHVR